MKPSEEIVREQLRHEADEAPDAGMVRQRILADIAEREASGPRPGRTLLVLAATAAAIVTIAGATIYAANDALSSDESKAAGHASAGDDRACVIDSPSRSSEWLNGISAQDGVEAVTNALKSDFGTGYDSLAGLRQGLIGVAIDDVNERLVVVVDPSLLDLKKLQGRLTAASGKALMVTVTTSCNSAQDLINVRRKLPSVSQNIGIALSPYDSTWHVRLSRTDRDLGERLISQADGLITVEYVANPGGVRL